MFIIEFFRNMVTNVKNWEGWKKLNFSDLGIENLLFWSIITLFGSLFINWILFLILHNTIVVETLANWGWSCFILWLTVMLVHLILLSTDLIDFDNGFNWLYFLIYAISGLLFLIILGFACIDTNTSDWAIPNWTISLVSGTISLITTMIITSMFGPIIQRIQKHSEDHIAISQMIQATIIIGSSIIFIILL